MRSICTEVFHVADFAGTEARRDDGDRVYWGGYGPDAYCQVTIKSDKVAFGGVSWLAATREDLIRATKISVGL